MNHTLKYLAPLLTGIIAISLSSCAATSTSLKLDSASLPPPAASETSQATQSEASGSVTTALKQSPTSTLTQNTITLNIYHADSQCEALVSERVAVPTESTVEAAVGKVIEQRNSSDFNLAGYRVNVNRQKGIATVDMRLLPDSRRKFVSLSSCEQFALFGSLRKTLTSNQSLKIKDVRFTEQGEEISL